MDKILICSEDTSNKFWGYKNEALPLGGFKVTCSWGRVGTAGQSKVFTFPNQWDADSFVLDKMEEKMAKGYTETTKEQLDLQITVAQTIGVGNKIDKLIFVKREVNKLVALDPKKLHDPGIEPMVYAKILGRRVKEDYGTAVPTREFLLGLKDAKVIRTTTEWPSGTPEIQSELPVEINDEYKQMSDAVGSCIGKLLL